MSVQGKPPAMRPGGEPDSPAAMRPGGLRGVSPQDDIPRSSRAWGCPPRSPGAGATLTRVHLSSYPHESGTPRPQNFAPPRSWTGSSTHGRVYVRSSYFPDFMSARAVTYGCVLHRNCLYAFSEVLVGFAWGRGHQVAKGRRSGRA